MGSRDGPIRIFSEGLVSGMVAIGFHQPEIHLACNGVSPENVGNLVPIEVILGSLEQ
jgi:hypothetical protein